MSKGSFKRSLFGYKPSEVDEAIAGHDAELERATERLRARDLELVRRAEELAEHLRRVEALEGVTRELAERVVQRERELRELRGQLARLRSEGEAGLESLVAMVRELDEVRRQARRQATRIRLRALRDAAEITERLKDLSKRPEGVRDRTLEAIAEAIRKAEGEDLEALTGGVAAAAAANGHEEADPDELFQGLIEVEIGPLSDFSQLVGFEDAASAIGATSQISVKRFAKNRATLEMRLAHPVELLNELEKRAPFEFKVRDLRHDRLVLDVDSGE